MMSSDSSRSFLLLEKNSRKSKSKNKQTKNKPGVRGKRLPLHIMPFSQTPGCLWYLMSWVTGTHLPLRPAMHMPTAWLPVLLCSYKLNIFLPSNFPILDSPEQPFCEHWTLQIRLLSWVRALDTLSLAWKKGHPTASTVLYLLVQTQRVARKLSHISLSFYPLGWKLADNNLSPCHVPA